MCEAKFHHKAIHSWLCLFCVILCIHFEVHHCSDICERECVINNCSRTTPNEEPLRTISIKGIRSLMCRLRVYTRKECEDRAVEKALKSNFNQCETFKVEYSSCLKRYSAGQAIQTDVMAVNYNELAGIIQNHTCLNATVVKPKRTSKLTVWLMVLASVTIISGVGLVVVILIPLMGQSFYDIMIQFLIALAVGSLVGDAFLHLIPHALFPHEGSHEHDEEEGHEHGPGHQVSSHSEIVLKTLMGLAGILVFFVAERIVIVYQGWRAEVKQQHQQAQNATVRQPSNSLSAFNSSAESHTVDNSYSFNNNKKLQPPELRTSNQYAPNETDPVLPLMECHLYSKKDEKASHDHLSSKKHRFGWGCQQHSKVNRTTRHSDKHSASTPFSGLCNQRGTFQTLMDCPDPMNEENCLSSENKLDEVVMDGGPQDNYNNFPPAKQQFVMVAPPVTLSATTTSSTIPTEVVLGGGAVATAVAPPPPTTTTTLAVIPTEDASGMDSKPHGHHHGHSHNLSSVKSIAYTILAGDGLHNFCDGIAIGAAFTSSRGEGIAVSLAVLCHELPHELGDFAVLLHAGISVRSAIYYNIFSSILCFAGAILGVFAGNHPSAVSWIFMFTAGMFFYIALVDMVPELSTKRLEGHKICAKPILLLLLQTIGMILGAMVMFILSIYDDKLY